MRVRRRVLRHAAAAVVCAAALLSGGPSATGASTVVVLPVPGPAVVLPVPGPAVVLTAFRAPSSPYGPGHRGVDLAAPVGAVVRSATAGVVSHAGPVAGRGTVSVDMPDGLRLTYEPVLATVRAGDRVGAGQSIGLLTAGHADCAPASCLHWGARLPDGSYLDPMGLVGRLAVRLLPWGAG